MPEIGLILSPPIRITLEQPEAREIVIEQKILKLTPVVEQGLPGPTGIGALVEFLQPTPSSLWIINHNLNAKLRSIFVQDILGNGIEGYGIENPSLNQTRLTFTPALAGVAQITGG